MRDQATELRRRLSIARGTTARREKTMAWTVDKLEKLHGRIEAGEEFPRANLLGTLRACLEALRQHEVGL